MTQNTQAGSVRFAAHTMDHAKGVWAGMRPQWWTATHIETGASVTWHEHSDVSHHKQREAALACLALLIEATGVEPLPRPTPGEDT